MFLVKQIFGSENFWVKLGLLFLEEVEFVGGWVVWCGVGGVNSNNHVKPNQVEVRLNCG